MKCDEFKSKVADLFDKNVDPAVKAECEKHINECEDCKAYYEQLVAVSEMMEPKHLPVQTKRKAKSIPMFKKIIGVAAAVAIVVFGVVTLMGSLFPTEAKADNRAMKILSDGINNAEEIKSYEIDFKVRTLPNENFAYFDPSIPFINVTVKSLSEDGVRFWRVEKKGGRTAVFDGQKQYMWIPGILKYVGTKESNMLEEFSFFVNPRNLLMMQKAAVERKDAKIEYKSETNDNIVITRFTAIDNDILALLTGKNRKKYQCSIENTFSKTDNQLTNVKAWVEHKGEKTLMLYSDKILLNAQLDKKQVVDIPDKNGSGRIELTDKQDVAGERLHFLQNESATEAARRIMEALTSGDCSNAKEALKYYPTSLLLQKFKGGKVSSFSEPKSDGEYAGVFVFYKFTNAKGKTSTEHIALRCDNSDKIWIADGGL